jgi:hypothetical protein
MSDEIDMSIFPKVCVTDIDVEVHELKKSELYVLIPSKNALFNHDFVTFDDLRNQRFIGWDTKEVPLLSDVHSKACEDKGFKPEFVAYAKKMGDLMTLSILHNALGFAACNSTIVDSKEFKLMPVTGSEASFGLVCAWKKNNKNQSLKKLIRILGK